MNAYPCVCAGFAVLESVRLRNRVGFERGVVAHGDGGRGAYPEL